MSDVINSLQIINFLKHSKIQIAFIVSYWTAVVGGYLWSKYQHGQAWKGFASRVFLDASTFPGSLLYFEVGKGFIGIVTAILTQSLLIYIAVSIPKYIIIKIRDRLRKRGIEKQIHE